MLLRNRTETSQNVKTIKNLIMSQSCVTIAAFPTNTDIGFNKLKDTLTHYGIPHHVDEIEDDEADPNFWASELPFRLRTTRADGPNAYQTWMDMMANDNPYIVLSEEELEHLALQSSLEAESDGESGISAQPETKESETTWSRILEGPDVRPHKLDGVACPIDSLLVEWVDESLHWISQNLFNPLEKPIVALDDYQDWEYMADLEDADFVLSRTCSLMGIPNEIDLYFLHSSSMEGCYHQEDGRHFIGIEYKTLWNAQWLIDVMAHELCHYQLLGGLQEQIADELVTDLLVVAHGFGLLKGNSSFISEHSGSVTGNFAYLQWKVGRRGYLPRQVIAFAMALIEYRRCGGLPEWFGEINKEWREDFQQSMEYIEQHADKFMFGNA